MLWPCYGHAASLIWVQQPLGVTYTSLLKAFSLAGTTTNNQP